MFSFNVTFTSPTPLRACFNSNRTNYSLYVLISIRKLHLSQVFNHRHDVALAEGSPERNLHRHFWTLSGWSMTNRVGIPSKGSQMIARYSFRSPKKKMDLLWGNAKVECETKNTERHQNRCSLPANDPISAVITIGMCGNECMRVRPIFQMWRTSTATHKRYAAEGTRAEAEKKTGKQKLHVIMWNGCCWRLQ